MERVQKAVDSSILLRKNPRHGRSQKLEGAYKTLSYFYGMNEKRLPKTSKFRSAMIVSDGMKET